MLYNLFYILFKISSSDVFQSSVLWWVQFHAFFIAFSSDSRMVQRNKEETYRRKSQEDKKQQSLGEARKRDLGEAGKDER